MLRKDLIKRLEEELKSSLNIKNLANYAITFLYLYTEVFNALRNNDTLTITYKTNRKDLIIISTIIFVLMKKDIIYAITDFQVGYFPPLSDFLKNISQIINFEQTTANSYIIGCFINNVLKDLTVDGLEGESNVYDLIRNYIYEGTK
jgi:hypothetical protein